VDFHSQVNHIFCICQIPDKKLEYNEAVHQLFVHFKKGYSSVRRDVLCNILTTFGITVTSVTLIKMCLNASYTKNVAVGEHLTHLLLRII